MPDAPIELSIGYNLARFAEDPLSPKELLAEALRLLHEAEKGGPLAPEDAHDLEALRAGIAAQVRRLGRGWGMGTGEPPPGAAAYVGLRHDELVDLVQAGRRRSG